MFRLTIICLFLIAYVNDVSGKKDCDLQSEEEASGTLLIGKFVMLPILAGVGLKFLVLLPIILSKIALLGILSFVSSNLSLLVSAVMGVRSYFFEDRPEEDYDYDNRHKSKYESQEPDQHDDHRYQKSNHDYRDQYPHRYSGYTSYHSDYKAHDYHAPKKRFRPFKIFGKIKDVIKDLFHKSRNHEDTYREYDKHYKHHPHDLRDDYDEYYHKEREARLKDSGHPMGSHHSVYKDVSRVPQDWSLKEEATHDAMKTEKGEDEGQDLRGDYQKEYDARPKDSGHPMESYSPSRVPHDWSHKEEVSHDATKTEKGGDEGQLKIVVDDSGWMQANLNRTLSTMEYKVYENEPKFKEPFIVFGLRPQTVDNESPAAFYATNYQITDLKTEPQADTSK